MTIYFSASWLPSLTQHSSVRTRLSCTNTPVKSHTDLMTITDHCITIPCSACTLPPSGDESRSSSCPSSERWKGAMSAEGRPVKRWSLTEGGGRTQRPAPTEDSFHATGIWSWTELCLFMLHCSTVWTTSPSSITRPRVEGINSTVWLVNLVLHSAVTAGISKTKRGLLGSWEALVSLVSEKRSWFYVLQET